MTQRESFKLIFHLVQFLGPLPARLGRGPHEVKKNKTTAYSSHFNDIEKLGYGSLTHLPS